MSKQLEILDLASTYDPSSEGEPTCKACGDRGYTMQPRPRRQRRTIVGHWVDVASRGMQRVACGECCGRPEIYPIGGRDESVDSCQQSSAVVAPQVEALALLSRLWRLSRVGVHGRIRMARGVRRAVDPEQEGGG